ncbi:MAG: hypothetical protein U1E65_34235 [Myxococcota bacterium]
MATMLIPSFSTPSAALADWFGKMSETQSAGLPMDPMAKRMMDGFSKLGVKSAAEITEKTVSDLGKALGVSAEALQKATQKCPFSHGLPKLEG